MKTSQKEPSLIEELPLDEYMQLPGMTYRKLAQRLGLSENGVHKMHRKSKRQIYIQTFSTGLVRWKEIKIQSTRSDGDE